MTIATVGPRVREQAPWAAIVGALVAAPALVVVPWVANGDLGEVWSGLVVAAVLAVASYALVRRATQAELDPRVVQLVLLAPVVRLLGSLARYYVTFVLLPAADANEYHVEGTRLAAEYGQLNFGADLGREFVGTGFIRGLTGLVYVFTGPNRLAGFLVFSFLALWGTFLLYRAFCLSVPDGDRRRYALLVFFLPSLLFWPSSTGKESWMLFVLGLTALGGARAVAQRRGAFPLLGLGLLGIAAVRPHIALIAFAGLAVAYLLRRNQRELAPAPPRRVAGLVVFLLIGSLVVGRVEAFLGIDELTAESVDESLAATEATSSQKGSEFDAVRVRTPVDFLPAFVTVLYRPFPTEAGNLTSILAATEAALLLLLTVASWRRLRSLPRRMGSMPYVALAVVFGVLFVVAFSAIGNFGILARQRTQVLPFLAVWLSLPAPPRRLRLPR